MKSKFSQFLDSLQEADTFEQDKEELIDFIQGLDKETFGELMDVLSSIMTDPTAIGDEDDAGEEIEGDDDIIDVIDDGANPEEIASALEESVSDTILNERGNISAAERLKIAKNKKRDPRIRKMQRIKNAWRKKCKKRGLTNQKGTNGKWGCGKTNHALSVLAQKYQRNRQKAVEA